jgi:hypothetical protein
MQGWLWICATCCLDAQFCNMCGQVRCSWHTCADLQPSSQQHCSCRVQPRSRQLSVDSMWQALHTGSRRLIDNHHHRPGPHAPLCWHGDAWPKCRGIVVVVVYSVDTSVNMRDHTHCRYSLRDSCCSHQHISMLHTSSTSTHILVSEAHTATQDTLVRSHHSGLSSKLCAKPKRALYACGCNPDQ